MPKCANVVALVVVTNILTIVIFTSFRYQISYRNEVFQPLPQPGQLNQVVQTGRVIQAVMEKESSDNSLVDSSDLFEKRQERIDSYCAYKKEHPRGPFTNDPSKLFLLKDRHLVWCPVFKAGSSTWLSTLVDLSSKSKADKDYIKRSNLNNPLKQGRTVAPALTRSGWIKFMTEVQKGAIEETSFIVVRHPFERLVSAFRDKLERKHTPDYLKDFYYKSYGKKIVAKYRHQALKVFGDEFFSAENNYGAPLPVADGRRPTSDLPIFWEFVQYVIEARRERMDEHWKPTVAYCSMCIIQYQYVIKFEDYINEGTQFLRQSNLEQYLPENALHEHTNTNRPGIMSSYEVTQKYFSMLSNQDISKLYQVYEDDFKLFGYEFTFRNLTLPP